MEADQAKKRKKIIALVVIVLALAVVFGWFG